MFKNADFKEILKWAAKAKRFEIVASTRDKLILRKVKQVRMLEKKLAKRESPVK